MAQAARLGKELAMLEKDPPPGVSVWPKESKLTELEAVLEGPEGSPYESGFFKLDISLSSRYPFEPPKVTFRTAIYHPNIDAGGRICLDTLNMPPKGAWKPSVNIGTVLTSLRLLLSEPNADDPLMDDIAAQMRTNPQSFRRAAAEHTRLHARPAAVGASQPGQVAGGSGPSGQSAEAAAGAADAPEREAKRPRAEPRADEVAAQAACAAIAAAPAAADRPPGEAGPSGRH